MKATTMGPRRGSPGTEAGQVETRLALWEAPPSWAGLQDSGVLHAAGEVQALPQPLHLDFSQGLLLPGQPLCTLRGGAGARGAPCTLTPSSEAGYE